MQRWLSNLGILLVLVGAAVAQESTEGLKHLPRGKGHFRGQAVTYRVWEGQALVQGDILLGPVAELENEKSPHREAVVLAADRFRWPDGVVVYELDAAVTAPSRVTQAIAEWEAKTQVRFRVRTNEADYVRVQRAADAGTCNATLGRAGGRQTVNLGDACSVGNTVHEFGHTLGLLHTQARIDRNRNLRVLYENIDKDQWDQYDQSLASAQDIGPYDFGSIMHYGVSGFTRNARNSMDTIPTGIPVGQRTALSPGDILAIRQIYGENPTGVTITTHPVGLPLEVDGERIITPKRFDWANGETHVVRAVEVQPDGGQSSRLQFTSWSDGGAIEHTITAGAETRLVIANYAAHLLFRTSVSPDGAGTVTISPESPDGFYPFGTQLKVTAIPAEGFQHLDWIPGAGGFTALANNQQGAGANPNEISLRLSDLFYVARFTRGPITTVTTLPAALVTTVDGTAAYTPRNFLWLPGSTHTVSIAEIQTVGSTANRAKFKSWSNGGERAQPIGAEPQGGVLVAETQLQHQLLRSFDFLRLTTTTAPTLANFRIQPAADGGYYDAGSEIEISAEGNEGIPFTNWFGDIGGNQTPQKLKVTEQLVLGANFISPGLFHVRGVINQASQQPEPIAPGGAYVMYSPGIGPSDSLTGYEVLFGEVAARVIKVDKDTLTFVAPESLGSASTTTLNLRTPRFRISRPETLVPFSPGMYTVAANGRGQARAVNPDGSENSPSQPAPRGSVVRLTVTGIGTATEFRAEIGGVECEITGMSKLDAPGQVAFDVRIADGVPSGEAVPAGIWSLGSRTQLGVTIAVQ